MANLNKCAVCGTEYSYCPNCAGSHAWRFYTDTHEHYQIYLILKQYAKGVFDKDAARAAFSKIGITADSNLCGLKENTIKVITEIVTVDNEPEGDKTVIKKTKKSKLYKDED